MSNIAIVEQFIAAWNRVDLDAVCALMTDDVIYHNMPMDPIEGLAAARQVMEGFKTEQIDWQMLNISEAGNVVLTERLDRFRYGDKWLELPVMGAFEFQDGKIKVWRDYFDMNTYMTQIQAITGAT